jgi:hypothetical protein
MERDGLTYTQHGVEVRGSKHFDFRSLIDAYANYIQVYDRWLADNATDAELDDAWYAIGVMQRDVPAYVAQEYCRPDRLFHPRPVFNESNLPRTLTFYNHRTDRNEEWYPIVISATSGLGVDFALLRVAGAGSRAIVGGAGSRVILGGRPAAGGPGAFAGIERADFDLTAVISLDEASTVELTRARENLKPLVHGLDGPGL